MGAEKEVRDVEVVALVGSAGTGKSHRALLVARKLGTSTLIDDGLLVSGSKVIAGKSAKYEKTRLGAVHRAIFSDAAHATSVKEALQRLAPPLLLIIGTSTKMIDRICSNLDLPAPSRTMFIDEVSTPAQIQAAQKSRLTKGKHVIPAPTLEVKRGFRSGVVLPLTLRYRGDNVHRPIVINTSIVRPTYSRFGRFYIAENALKDLARHLLKEHDFIHTVHSVRVQTTPEGTTVSAEVTLIPGDSLITLLRTAQANVHAGIEKAAAITTLWVNLRAVDIAAEAWRGSQGDVL